MNASVIIPTYNRADQLFRTMKSLVELDFDKSEFEIIVVDNGSTDSTKEIVENYIKGNPQNRIRYFYDDIPGLLTGRHRGAKESKNEILVFIDDDVHVEKGWLSAIMDTFHRNPNAHLVGGKCLPLYETEPPRWINYFWKYIYEGKMLVDLSLCEYGEREKEVSPMWIWGLNYSIRKSTFLECGGFHPDSIPPQWQQYQGDGETGLSMKILEKGYKSFYNPKATVYHEVPSGRMTHAYFEKRKFYQGVCNSYTEIRRNKGLHDSKINYKFIKIFKRIARKILGLVKKESSSNVRRDLSKKEKLEFALLTSRFDAMERAGYNFHRKAAMKSAKVLDWILKENYFDYKFPE